MSAIQNAITVLDKMDERLSAHGYLDTDGARVEIKEAIQALQSLEGKSEPFAYCFTDVSGKPSEFCDSPRHASEGDLRIRTPLYTTPQPPAVPDGYDYYSSDDGDTWLESPSDIEFVNGLKVGDEYEILAVQNSVSLKFRVTKAPDESSDDYEVERVDAMITAAQQGDGNE